MWLYTKNGFYSACQNNQDNALIHVRTQFRGDLEHLREVCSPFSPSAVIETPYGDYRFRLDISREGWNYFIAKESAQIDYAKFKPAVKDHSLTRKEAYLACFNEMMQAGRDESYYEYIEGKAKGAN